MIGRITVIAAAGLVVLVLLVFSVRLFAADILSRGSTLYARETAVDLFPGSVSYILSLVDLRRQNDLDIRRQLRMATQADPVDARLFIELGLECERAGDYDSALRYLLESSRLSQEFLPRWTLANYYFRRNDLTQFRFWMHSALEVGAPNLTAAFRLLWNSGLTTAEISTVIPHTRDAVVGWLRWCVDQGRLDAAREAAAESLRQWPGESAGVLIRYCALLARGSASARAQAADLWNALVARGLLHQRPVYPAGAPTVEDPDFSTGPGDLAFGWHMIPVEGVVSDHYGRGIHFRLDGNEPEKCDLLTQLLSLRPGSKNVLRCRYDSTGLLPGSGLYWHIEDPDAHTALEETPIFLNDQQKEVTAPFTVPPG
ncbi:MAG TPA: hypothetical protein VFA04_12265, partial [Bryobacteraceae bacterium]|nr:hypothetical protein [Bryobacteraceae bacterium]